MVPNPSSLHQAAAWSCQLPVFTPAAAPVQGPLQAETTSSLSPHPQGSVQLGYLAGTHKGLLNECLLSKMTASALISLIYASAGVLWAASPGNGSYNSSENTATVPTSLSGQEEKVN